MRLGKKLGMQSWDPKALFEKFDADHDGHLSAQEITDGMRGEFGVHLTPTQLFLFNQGQTGLVNEKEFSKAFNQIVKEWKKVE